ncbi:mediator of RNA polymerase II transcription subunit 8 [Orbilia oligospora]|uniref:Mediator of RNA polymerase II transcription subunit 8 n=2 Tax=Orbilia oligospora TaxID=2813651 RepID=A0A7C8KC19_ORBOL|nr:mediator of RNA polymerase II transcription subunit 8 [Orbilia oligospora]
MASPTLPVEALDRMRIQLGLLSQSINSLLQELRTSDPLPPWTTLTAQLAILNSQLSTISRSLHQHSASLSTTVVFPLPTFPGRTQDGQLHRLLGKKLSPEVQDWIQIGRKAGLALTSKPKNDDDDSDDDSEPEAEDEQEADDDDDDEMDEDDGDDPDSKRRKRHWALKIVQKDQRSRDWDSDFTKEEIEAVGGDLTRIQTGLKTHLDGTIIKRSMDSSALSTSALNKRDENGWTLEMMFRFMSTGMRPAEDHPGVYGGTNIVTGTTTNNGASIISGVTTSVETTIVTVTDVDAKPGIDTGTNISPQMNIVPESIITGKVTPARTPTLAQTTTPARNFITSITLAPQLSSDIAKPPPTEQAKQAPPTTKEEQYPDATAIEDPNLSSPNLLGLDSNQNITRTLPPEQVYQTPLSLEEGKDFKATPPESRQFETEISSDSDDGSSIPDLRASVATPKPSSPTSPASPAFNFPLVKFTVKSKTIATTDISSPNASTPKTSASNLSSFEIITPDVSSTRDSISNISLLSDQSNASNITARLTRSRAKALAAAQAATQASAQGTGEDVSIVDQLDCLLTSFPVRSATSNTISNVKTATPPATIPSTLTKTKTARSPKPAKSSKLPRAPRVSKKPKTTKKKEGTIPPNKSNQLEPLASPSDVSLPADLDDLLKNMDDMEGLFGGF